MDAYRIYLDVCCLNRPFDDLSQDRIHFESDAVLSILSRCESGIWSLVSSEIVDLELTKLTNFDKQKKVQKLCMLSVDKLILNKKSENRARFFQKYGMKIMDSLHLAIAESDQVDVILTTDDIFLKKAKNMKLSIKIENPVTWLMEVLGNE